MSEEQERRVGRMEPHRWRVVRALAAIDTPATIDQVVDELEDEAATDALAAIDTWDRTHEQLHDVDLPALDEAGLVDFDGGRGLVTVPPEATEQFERAADEATDGTDRGVPWQYLYLLATVVAVGVLALAVVAFVPREPFLATVAMATVVGLFGALALLHLVASRRRRRG